MKAVPTEFRIRRETSEPSKYGLLVHLLSSRFFYLTKDAFEVLSTIVPSIQLDAGGQRKASDDSTSASLATQRRLAHSILAELQQRPEPPRGPIIETLSRPTHVTVEISYRCNLRCGYCSTGSPSKQEETFAFADCDMQGLAHEFLKSGIMSVFVSGGEPFLIDNLFPFAESLIRGGIAVTIATNGTVSRTKQLHPFLQHSYPSFCLQVKLDTMNAATFSRITKSPARLHSRVLENISALAQLGIPIAIQTAVCPDILESPDELVKFAKEVKAVGIRLSPMFPDGDGGDGAFSPWSIEALRGYLIHLEELAKDSPIQIYFPDVALLTQSRGACEAQRTACKALRSYIRVSADGRWVPCNAHRDITLGTILKDSLDRAWNSTNAEELRNQPCRCPVEFRWIGK